MPWDTGGLGTDEPVDSFSTPTPAPYAAPCWPWVRWRGGRGVIVGLASLCSSSMAVAGMDDVPVGLRGMLHVLREWAFLVVGASPPVSDTDVAGLRATLRGLDEAMRESWDRSLPFNELVGDRWERARRLGFGEGASVYDSAIILGDVAVGDQTWIGPWTMLDGVGGLRIGSYCSISAGVHIYTHDTVAWALTLGQAPRRESAVTIGDGCYIGPQSVISMGVTVGDRSVVGANSFVKNDVPPGSVVAGSPARVVGRVEEDGHGSFQLRYTSVGKD